MDKEWIAQDLNITIQKKIIPQLCKKKKKPSKLFCIHKSVDITNGVMGHDKRRWTIFRGVSQNKILQELHFEPNILEFVDLFALGGSF